MISRTHELKKGARLGCKALLPAALALVLSPWSAHAATATTWAPTHSHAVLLKTGTAKSANYVVNSHARPQVNAVVAPMDNAKPVHVAVSLNLRNTDQLQAFLKNLNTKGNASYGKFLTPAQFKASYAPTDAQVQAVVAHLQQSGFTHITVAPNNLLIYADGNATAIGTAFNATMKSYTDNGKLRFGNDSDVMVPQALGGIVGSVIGLQNIEHKHPLNKIGNEISTATATGTQTAPAAVTHAPTQFPAIYDVGNTPTGFNTTVGIITWGDLTFTQKDLSTMVAAAGMSPVNVTVVPVTNSGVSTNLMDDPSADVEWNLDSQSIVGSSGGVKQLMFYSAANADQWGDETLSDADITAAYNQAVQDNLVKILNISLGEDETIANQAGNQQADDNIFVQAVAQGQTVSVASGDQGVYVASNGEFETNAGALLPAPFALNAYSISEPASSPNVIAVGGTQLMTSGTTTWAGENAWNDGIADAGDGDNRVWATTGGYSKFEAAPAWQATALNATVRQVPDIAFDASQTTGAQIFYGGLRYAVGGTSLASPIFVGMFARVQTYANNSIGFPASMMYRDFPNNPNVLHDVTSGNNGVNYGGSTYGFNASTGWDATTGFGSLDISKFNALAYTWGNGSSATTAPPPAPPIALTPGTAVTTQGTGGSIQQFMISVPSGKTSLTIRTSGGSGDVSLYVKLGTNASSTAYDYSSVHPNTNTESVTIRAPAAGTYYITVTSPAVFTGVSVLGSLL